MIFVDFICYIFLFFSFYSLYFDMKAQSFLAENSEIPILTISGELKVYFFLEKKRNSLA